MDSIPNFQIRYSSFKDLRATSHLSLRLTVMCVTVNEVSSHLCKILILIIVKTYLQTEEALLHHSTPSCNMLQLCKTS